MTRTRRRLSVQELGTWRSFLRAYAHVTRQLERDLQAGRALSLSDYGVLFALTRGPGDGIRPMDLVETVGLTKSGLTRVVDRLAEHGYVERRSCPTDQRGQLVAVTPSGRRVFRRAAPAHLRGIARYFIDRLTPPELGALGRAFRSLASDDEGGPA